MRWTRESADTVLYVAVLVRYGDEEGGGDENRGGREASEHTAFELEESREGRLP